MDVYRHNAVTDRIIALFERASLPCKLIAHDACCTSEESFAARKAASGEEVMGAKALLVKCYPRGGEPYMAMVVLPGFATLDSDRLRQMADLKKLRFATPEEIDACTGLVRGCIPPFASEVFPSLSRLYVDEALCQESRMGFNAASLCHSLLVDTQGYLQVLKNPQFF